MIVTLRLTDILLVLLTACACAVAIYAIALMRRMNAVLMDWRKTALKLDEVLPDIQHFCATSGEAMQSVKGLADQSTRVVTDVAEVTGQIRDAAEEGLARLHGLMGVLNTASMLMSSFKAGLAAVQACRQDGEEKPDSDEGSFEEADDEQRDL